MYNSVFLIPYKKGRTFGYCDISKKIIIENIYESAYPFENDIAIVLQIIDSKKKYGVINKKGEVIIPLEYDDIQINSIINESLTLIMVRQNWLFGLFDKEGYVITQCLNERTICYSEGLIATKFPNGYYGYLDVFGNEFIYPKFNYANPFNNGLAKVENDKKIGYINKMAEFVIKCIYDAGSIYSDGLIGVKNNNKWGFIDDSGNTKIDFKFDYVGFFHNGLCPAELDKKWGYIDKEGKWVIPNRYSRLSLYGDKDNFIGNIQKVSNDNKTGFINLEGEEIIPIIYDYADFSEGVIVARLNKKWGFLDSNGRIIISFIYDDAGSFSQGLAAVKKNGKFGFIDINENIIIPFIYDYACSFSQGLAFVEFDITSRLDPEIPIYDYYQNKIECYIDMNGVEYFDRSRFESTSFLRIPKKT